MATKGYDLVPLSNGADDLRGPSRTAHAHGLTGAAAGPFNIFGGRVGSSANYLAYDLDHTVKGKKVRITQEILAGHQGAKPTVLVQFDLWVDSGHRAGITTPMSVDFIAGATITHLTYDTAVLRAVKGTVYLDRQYRFTQAKPSVKPQWTRVVATIAEDGASWMVSDAKQAIFEVKSTGLSALTSALVSQLPNPYPRQQSGGLRVDKANTPYLFPHNGAALFEVQTGTSTQHETRWSTLRLNLYDPKDELTHTKVKATAYPSLAAATAKASSGVGAHSVRLGPVNAGYRFVDITLPSVAGAANDEDDVGQSTGTTVTFNEGSTGGGSGSGFGTFSGQGALTQFQHPGEFINLSVQGTTSGNSVTVTWMIASTPVGRGGTFSIRLYADNGTMAKLMFSGTAFAGSGTTTQTDTFDVVALSAAVGGVPARIDVRDEIAGAVVKSFSYAGTTTGQSGWYLGGPVTLVGGPGGATGVMMTINTDVNGAGRNFYMTSPSPAQFSWVILTNTGSGTLKGGPTYQVGGGTSQGPYGYGYDAQHPPLDAAYFASVATTYGLREGRRIYVLDGDGVIKAAFDFAFSDSGGATAELSAVVGNYDDGVSRNITLTPAATPTGATGRFRFEMTFIDGSVDTIDSGTITAGQSTHSISVNPTFDSLRLYDTATGPGSVVGAPWAPAGALDTGGVTVTPSDPWLGDGGPQPWSDGVNFTTSLVGDVYVAVFATATNGSNASNTLRFRAYNGGALVKEQSLFASVNGADRPGALFNFPLLANTITHMEIAILGASTLNWNGTVSSGSGVIGVPVGFVFDDRLHVPINVTPRGLYAQFTATQSGNKTTVTVQTEPSAVGFDSAEIAVKLYTSTGVLAATFVDATMYTSNSGFGDSHLSKTVDIIAACDSADPGSKPGRIDIFDESAVRTNSGPQTLVKSYPWSAPTSTAADTLLATYPFSHVTAATDLDPGNPGTSAVVVVVEAPILKHLLTFKSTATSEFGASTTGDHYEVHFDPVKSYNTGYTPATLTTFTAAGLATEFYVWRGMANSVISTTAASAIEKTGIRFDHAWGVPDTSDPLSSKYRYLPHGVRNVNITVKAGSKGNGNSKGGTGTGSRCVDGHFVK